MIDMKRTQAYYPADPDRDAAANTVLTRQGVGVLGAAHILRPAIAAKMQLPNASRPRHIEERLLLMIVNACLSKTS
jgi:hypothetical protein